MRTKVLYTKRRARKGEGRKKIAHIQVPREVKEMLDEFKDAYSACYGRKVSYEQMFRDWVDHGRIDTKVWKRVQEMKKNSEAFSEEAVDVTRKAAAVDLASILLDGQNFHEIVITDDSDEEPVAEVSPSQDDVPVQQPEVAEESPEGGLSADERRQRLSYWFSQEYREKRKAEEEARPASAESAWERRR